MSMHGGGAGGGGGARMGMRGMTRSRDLLEHRIKKGTLPRILKLSLIHISSIWSVEGRYRRRRRTERA